MPEAGIFANRWPFSSQEGLSSRSGTNLESLYHLMDTHLSVDGVALRFTPVDQAPSAQANGAPRDRRTSGVARSGDGRHRRYDPFVNSLGMRAVKAMVDAAAATDTTVLISGEWGVGKELVARAVHQESPRFGHAFVKVNCAALPLDLLETELFGHERGALTGAYRSKPGKFELAQGGSIFLDEIGELPLPLQAKLLHALQDREFSRLGSHRDARVDIRVIAATNRDLTRLVDQGRFREDLYNRLNVVTIEVPPLRERVEEIPILVETFLDRYTRQYRRQRDVISPETMQLFHAYQWPGNIRELENTIKRIVLLGSQDWLAEELTDTDARPAPGAPPVPAAASVGLATLPTAGDEGLSLTAIARAAALQAERRALKQVLDRVHWNRRRAARLLKVSYRTLRRKIEQCGLLED
jgi:two-component system response regulator AtoC